MGKQIGIALLAILLLFLLPWLHSEPGQAREEPPPQEEPTPPPATETPDTPPDGIDSGTLLRVLLQGGVVEMDMGDYLKGVVRAEMPASFALEALKAQAVAARTYTLHKIENGGSENHPQADICDDITCCQAFLDEAAAAAQWGEEAEAYETKICRAVEETDGLCILYEGKPALAVFHSSSAGMTQDASSVWKGSVPYLKSVQSPEGEDTVPNYRSTATFSAAQLRQLLQEALPQAELDGSPSDWFTNIHQQANGTVTALTVGGVELGGNRLRTILDLRSACFTLSFAGDNVTFSVTGYGHGVGMSQYGANVLAGDGMTCREILAWYYSDTSVEAYVPAA